MESCYIIGIRLFAVMGWYSILPLVTLFGKFWPKWHLNFMMNPRTVNSWSYWCIRYWLCDWADCVKLYASYPLTVQHYTIVWENNVTVLINVYSQNRIFSGQQNWPVYIVSMLSVVLFTKQIHSGLTILKCSECSALDIFVYSNFSSIQCNHCVFDAQNIRC